MVDHVETVFFKDQWCMASRDWNVSEVDLSVMATALEKWVHSDQGFQSEYQYQLFPLMKLRKLDDPIALETQVFPVKDLKQNVRTLRPTNLERFF